MKSTAEIVDAIHETEDDASNYVVAADAVDEGDGEEISCCGITKKSTSTVKRAKPTLTDVESMLIQQLANFQCT